MSFSLCVSFMGSMHFKCLNWTAFSRYEVQNVCAKLSANIIPPVVRPDTGVCQTLQMITRPTPSPICKCLIQKFKFSNCSEPARCVCTPEVNTD